MKGLKGFKKPGLQLRRSQFSQKDLVLDGVDALRYIKIW